jgi:endonuclease/exonuclease/phosphatase family metal-dependent hydrolase
VPLQHYPEIAECPDRLPDDTSEIDVMNRSKGCGYSCRLRIRSAAPILWFTKYFDKRFSARYVFPLVIATSLVFDSCSSQELESKEKPSAARLSKPITLKIVTFNVWDSYFFPDHKRRMIEIGKFLARQDPDLVGIQEAFIEKDRELLLDQLKDSRLKYWEYFPSGAMGSGLMIISAFPLQETDFHKYSENGKWYKPWQGDWYAGKGAAHARIKLPEDIGHIDFYNTHAVAGYEKQDDLHTEDRVVQMKELAAFIKETSAEAFPAILVGDINCSPGSTEYQALIEQAMLTRLMNIDSGVDHIFGMENPDYRILLIDTREFSHFTSEEDEELRMSDHDSYISRIQIEPVR